MLIRNLSLAASAAILLAACGNDATPTSSGARAPAVEAPAPVAQPASVPSQEVQQAVAQTPGSADAPKEEEKPAAEPKQEEPEKKAD